MDQEEKGPGVWEDNVKSFLLPSSSLARRAPQPEPEDAEEALEEGPAPAGAADDESAEPPALEADEEAFSREALRPTRGTDRAIRSTSVLTPAAAVEAFDQPGTTKVGLLGGKGVGKSYLFHAMVSRTLDSQRSGALSYYIDRDTVRVYRTLDRDQAPRAVIPSEFIHDYASWNRLHSTTQVDQFWYRLRLQFRTGLIGQHRSFLDIDFLDGSGEALESGISKESEELWKAAFLDATVMVFCLPLWAAFPATGGALTDDDWEHREKVIRGFDSVVAHYKELRERFRVSKPVRSILALTMADDRRSALSTLRDRWIDPFVLESKRYLSEMRTATGVARYLSNARLTSDAVRKEFASAQDPVISGIPGRLDFDAGPPWLIPISAIDGAALEAGIPNGKRRGPGKPPPIPVHVELPLLVALCESHNALM